MIPGLVIGVLALLALAYIATPLRRAPAIPVDVDSDSELEERKHQALVAIIDLESERDVGKLSQADFEDLRMTYESEALAALSELDAVATWGGDQLEREIAAARAELHPERCSNCGKSLPVGSARCPRCES